MTGTISSEMKLNLNSVLDSWAYRERIVMSYLGVVWYAIYKENNHGI